MNVKKKKIIIFIIFFIVKIELYMCIIIFNFIKVIYLGSLKLDGIKKFM